MGVFIEGAAASSGADTSSRRVVAVLLGLLIKTDEHFLVKFVRSRRSKRQNQSRS